MADYCEKTFKTTMSLESFQKMAARTCRDAHWIAIEGRDRSEVPFTMILTVIFTTVVDRDRFIIALRFAEEARASGPPRPAPAKAAGGKQYASA
jgi:hypothetical protein